MVGWAEEVPSRVARKMVMASARTSRVEHLRVSFTVGRVVEGVAALTQFVSAATFISGTRCGYGDAFRQTYAQFHRQEAQDLFQRGRFMVNPEVQRLWVVDRHEVSQGAGHVVAVNAVRVVRVRAVEGRRATSH